MKFMALLFLSTLFLTTNAQVKTGIEVLTNQNFELLKEKKTGLITNPTGVDSYLKSTIDILFDAPEVELVALYGPEHGVRGNVAAGKKVENLTDPKTGLPVFSLYGKTRKPTPEMLKGIDVLVYDIQDIGSRSYTYISTLGLAMEAAAENDIEFVVLDRPNPLGGNKFEGPLTEPPFTSFVSHFPIPYVHGFTVGELATFINQNHLLPRGLKCNLKVVKMEGWTRDMNFEATGLQWVPSSPHIPNAHSAFYYPVSGILGELYVVNIGVGYTLPFQLFGADWFDATQLAQNLNDLNLPGVIFRPIFYKPYYSTFNGKEIEGVQVHLTDLEKAPLSLIQFYVLQEAHQLNPDKNVFELCDSTRLAMFDKVCGTDKVRIAFSKNFKVEDIIEIWTGDIKKFRKKAEKSFLY
ncbi:exo-beta-N-acetylmuramidase NamZ family protein [Thermophagus sp. OGC60D27]|uniref:exo-beta-N-acetylmuramidase NamZ family protein n=1 Tax=Thermophagus sp. OGC60D27 TaxID=3458415 RepID=UPI0040382968